MEFFLQDFSPTFEKIMKRIIILTFFAIISTKTLIWRVRMLHCVEISLLPITALLTYEFVGRETSDDRSRNPLSLIELPTDVIWRDRCRLNICIVMYNIWCRWYRCFQVSQSSIDKIDLYAFSKRLMGANYRKTVCCLICSRYLQ